MTLIPVNEYVVSVDGLKLKDEDIREALELARLIGVLKLSWYGKDARIRSIIVTETMDFEALKTFIELNY